MSSNQIGLDSLPFEIIEEILKCEVLSYVDICRIATCSQLLNCISRNNKLWCIKYQQAWPTMGKLYNPLSTDWRLEFQQRIQYRRVVLKKLQDLSQDFYHLENVSNDSFCDMKKLCDNHPLTDYILLGELYEIVNDSDRNSNLTIKYYAEKALVYVRHTMLDIIWRTFLDRRVARLYQNVPRPSLLKGACLTQQWCQPGKMDCTNGVSSKVNELIKLVFDEVKRVSPSHPLIKRGYNIIQNEYGEVIKKSVWSPAHCKTILNSINEVLFRKLKWKCSETWSTLDGIYINQVLDNKNGIPIIVGIIYETIASHLGVYLLPVNFPGRFLLKWLERPTEVESPYNWTYIDLVAFGEFKNEFELKELTAGHEDFSPVWIKHLTPVKVFSILCWNLVEIGRQHDESGEGISYLINALELLSILSPEDNDHKLLLARVYMHLRINITRVIGLLQEMVDNDPMNTGIVAHMYESAVTLIESQNLKNKTVKFNPRNEDNADVKFAVGMIMRHKRYHYRCVIYGWDQQCTASKDWIRQMSVDQLEHKQYQPFYNVLVSDGSNRYAAQENLELDSEKDPITHIEVGRYFESFHGSYYLPNEQKRLEYPDDHDVRDKLLSGVIKI